MSSGVGMILSCPNWITIVNSIFPVARLALLAFSALLIASCTQTTTSTHDGAKRTASLSAVEKSRQAKILSARKRAKALKEKSAREFKQKRSDALALRKSKRAERRKKRKAQKVSKGTRTALLVTKKKRKSKKRAASKTNKRKARRTSRSKKVRVKTRKAAYVAGRSRRVSLNAPWRCVPGRLKKVISQVSRRFGPVVVNSTYRSRGHNRRVGGKRRSYHLGCRAVDFRVRGRTRGLTRWLARHPLVGGYKRYRGGFYHIDTGPKRTW